MNFISSFDKYNYLSSIFDKLRIQIFNFLGLESKSFFVFLVSKSNIRDMNFSYLNINNPTDVISLSFLSSTSDNFIGDIFISPEVVKKHADKYGCSFGDEMERSFVHGVLHLLGYSHKGTLNHSEEMFKIQESILDLSQ